MGRVSKDDVGAMLRDALLRNAPQHEAKVFLKPSGFTDGRVGQMAPKTRAIEVDGAELAELDRQWASINSGEATVPHEQVVEWLQTWGTPAFKPWREYRPK